MSKSAVRGYFAIGIINGKCEANVGTLWRTANIFGAKYIFTIGTRYPKRQSADTMNTPQHIPLFEYNSWADFKNCIPRNAVIVAIELDDKSRPIENFVHPERAIYLLGAEDKGIPEEVLQDCRTIIQIPGNHSVNVGVAGSIVIYDRLLKNYQKSI